MKIEKNEAYKAVCGYYETHNEHERFSHRYNSVEFITTKLYIERLTAPDSADMIADANITSGQYFMVGNSLYKATANIANGSAIIVGTNCIRKSLSEALNEINA